MAHGRAPPCTILVHITAEWLKRCDLVYRLKGASKGGDEEVALAKELGIPVIYEGEWSGKGLKRFLENK